VVPGGVDAALNYTEGLDIVEGQLISKDPFRRHHAGKTVLNPGKFISARSTVWDF
jgi:hypothetical protein